MSVVRRAGEAAVGAALLLLGVVCIPLLLVWAVVGHWPLHGQLSRKDCAACDAGVFG